MDRKIKGIVIGVGNMGKVAVRCMLDHDIELVGAVDTDENIIGMNAAEISGSDKKCDIVITGSLDELLESIEADIAVIATETAVDDIALEVEKCIMKGINVATTSEESYYPWNTTAESAKKLDDLAKKHGVSIYGTGIQDVFYNNLSSVLAGACNRIDSIRCFNFLPLDDMGKVVAEEMFLGRQEQEYYNELEKNGGTNPLAEDTLTTAYAVAASMGLEVIGDEMKCVPIVADKPMYYRGMDITIPAGTIIGIDSVAGVTSKEGIPIKVVFSYKISDEGETPLIEWTVEGDPSLRLVVDNIKGEVTTCSTLVNRIPDVINAEPGFRTFLDLDKPMYRAHAMHEYISKK